MKVPGYQLSHYGVMGGKLHARRGESSYACFVRLFA